MKGAGRGETLQIGPCKRRGRTERQPARSPASIPNQNSSHGHGFVRFLAELHLFCDQPSVVDPSPEHPVPNTSHPSLHASPCPNHQSQPTCLGAACLLCCCCLLRLLFLLLLLLLLPPFSQGLAKLSSPQDNIPKLGPAQTPTRCTRRPLAFQHSLPSTVPIKMAYFHTPALA